MAADTSTLTRASWLEWLDAALAQQIDRLRARYSLSLDEFRGLYISDAQVDEALRAGSTDSPSAPLELTVRDEPALVKLQATCALRDAELAIVLVALAPEIDRKYEAVLAYLNDDVTRRHATVDLCLAISRAPRWVLEPDAPLVSNRIIDVVRTGASASWLTAAVVARDPVRRFVLGRDLARVPEAGEATKETTSIVRGIQRGLVTVVITTGDPLGEARAIAARLEKPLIEVVDTADARTRDALLTARLHDACVYYEIDERALESADGTAWIRAAARDPALTLFGIPPHLRGHRWQALFEYDDHEVLGDRRLDHLQRVELSSRALDERGVAVDCNAVAEVARLFSLPPTRIRHAAAVAARAPRRRGVGFEELARAARRQSITGLEMLAARVAPVYQWSDLVLPSATLERVAEFVSAIRARERVFGEWAFGRVAGGPSLRALFTGASGTGKTMSAAVIGREVGVDVFRIDLSAVVSKYIGETEKNLERIFSAATGSNAILFFDEADALFGKRSEVKDAHDRYANIETAYLLQRMEQHDGVMILATNLANHLDEAFSRRIHVEIEFPLPDAGLRQRLWKTVIPAGAPLAPDVDLLFMAEQFQLTGGEIRNAALTGALLAAHEHADISMRHLIRAVARLRRRQRKLPMAAEFKHHLATAQADGS